MQSIQNILKPVFIGLAGTVLLIVTLPFLLIIVPIAYFQRKQFEKKYAKYLMEISGKNFFCYNNRKNSKEYIEKNIIPYLDSQIEVVFLNGTVVESDFDNKFISEALYKLKHYRKFPHLMKVRDGKVIDRSINNPFYEVLNMKKAKANLLSTVNEFFNMHTKETMPNTD